VGQFFCSKTPSMFFPWFSHMNVIIFTIS
jgi:hypothetical protein